MSFKIKKPSISSIIPIVMIVVGVVIMITKLMPPKPKPVGTQNDPIAITGSPAVTDRLDPDEDLIMYPVGRFGPDAERLSYQDGEIILEIPRLDFKGPVLNGVDNDTLKDGVGLFDQAQLPGPENRNVSIAGHRDIHGKEFYFIDDLGVGDKIYLTYQGKRYTYEFEETFIVQPDDWNPIRIKEYSCVTLQSCTPIMVASHRIFVVGRLVDIVNLPPETDASKDELSSEAISSETSSAPASSSQASLSSVEESSADESGTTSVSETASETAETASAAGDSSQTASSSSTASDTSSSISSTESESSETSDSSAADDDIWSELESPAKNALSQEDSSASQAESSKPTVSRNIAGEFVDN